jgi:hypothetical protein
MHGDSAASRATRHRQLARIRAAAEKTEAIGTEIDAIKRAADKVSMYARDLRAEIDDALSEIQAEIRAHAGEEKR